MQGFLPVFRVFICTGITVNTVNTVNENSPAQVAGIMSKDSIVSVNGFKINNVSEISQKINESKEGDIVNIKVLKNGEEKNSLRKSGSTTFTLKRT